MSVGKEGEISNRREEGSCTNEGRVDRLDEIGGSLIHLSSTLPNQSLPRFSDHAGRMKQKVAQDGTKYILYCIPLHSEGFNQFSTIHPQVFSCGVDLLSVSLSQE